MQDNMKMKDHDYIELCAKISCTGCFACEAICKQDAIVRVKNDEGFLYPEIQYDKCISCHACQKVCPVLNPIVKNENGEIITDAAFYKTFSWELEATGTHGAQGTYEIMDGVLQGNMVYSHSGTYTLDGVLADDFGSYPFAARAAYYESPP